MSFSLRQTQEGRNALSNLRAEVEKAQKTRVAQGRTKASTRHLSVGKLRSLFFLPAD